MDKSYSNPQKTENLETEVGEKNGINIVLLTLTLICASFFLLNISSALKKGEAEGASKLENAILVFADKLEENEAVCAFLGIDEYEEKEIH